MKTNKPKTRQPRRPKQGSLNFKDIPITEKIIPMDRMFRGWKAKPIEAESGNEEKKT